MKVSRLHKTKVVDSDDEDSESDDDDDDVDEDPILETRSIPHSGCVNRLRVMPQATCGDDIAVVATWSETGRVHCWNISEQLTSLDASGPSAPASSLNSTPLYTFTQHTTEGYALDWSPLTKGRLLSGDCANSIYLHEPSGAEWSSTGVFAGHTGSVEDIQWSPTEQDVFSSCSVDQHIRFWDTRVPERRPRLSAHAHNSDINVISWNHKVGYLLVSGDDDGIIRIWDLRNFKKDRFVAEFTYLRGSITSVEWNPVDDSQIVVGSSDNQVTTWDMSLEPDPEGDELGQDTGAEDVPPQLLFQHLGQQDVKECHWHPQIPGLIISTASDGFNIYKSFNT
eukprot:TRINITY_DN826_c1_g1_i3.p1 TRINITY_DN826_c1_g1~~TRINITY_DN826_c1_g1_i3.p1  ORF type:complete len:338 (-),score=81.32 TRINITY_DN826_c1_g1_i3:37-1050(-)